VFLFTEVEVLLGWAFAIPVLALTCDAAEVDFFAKPRFVPPTLVRTPVDFFAVLFFEPPGPFLDGATAAPVDFLANCRFKRPESALEGTPVLTAPSVESGGEGFRGREGL
jgi:hypothetical protein